MSNLSTKFVCAAEPDADPRRRALRPPTSGAAAQPSAARFYTPLWPRASLRTAVEVGDGPEEAPCWSGLVGLLAARPQCSRALARTPGSAVVSPRPL